MDRNPFSFGDLALDEGFTDRRAELSQLKADMLNGQNVVLFAPRRFGKTSLVYRAVQELTTDDGLLVAQVDLMRTTTKEQFASKLAQSVYDQIATPLFRVRERASEIFRGLRIAPVMTIDPMDGSIGVSFRAGQPRADVDATIEGLLELPAVLAADRGRRAAVVFDEFQEVIELDPHLPALMRAVFQLQPDVSHVYLGSKRAMMHRLFNDANEPFWRSARQMELGPIPPDEFGAFIRARFDETMRGLDAAVVEEVMSTTAGHPYATQELCYALWEVTPRGESATLKQLASALAHVLRSENAHFTLLWERASRFQRAVLQALAVEETESMTSAAYRERHGLPSSSSVQKALDVLVADEVVRKRGPGSYAIAEPFLREWLVSGLR